jgi:DNA topoisomerase-1
MLQEFEAFESQTQARRNVVQAIKDVARRLGNTPSVCRKCYVHPAVFDTYLSGAMMKRVGQEIEEDAAPHALRQEEKALLRLLKGRLALAAA